MSSHSFFLLNRYETLLGNIGIHEFALTWLLTSWHCGKDNEFREKSSLRIFCG